MRIILTDHSVDRFVSRIAPHLSHAEARALLEERIPEAQPIKGRTSKGDRQLALSDPPCLLVVRRGTWRGDRGQIVATVLPPEENEVTTDDKETT